MNRYGEGWADLRGCLPVDVPSSQDGGAEPDPMEELHYMLVQALREGLTLGMTMKNVRLLAQQLGVDYEDVVN